MMALAAFVLAIAFAAVAVSLAKRLKRLDAELARARREADAWQTAWRADAENRMLARMYRKRMHDEDELARKIDQLIEEQNKQICACGHSLAEHADDGVSEGCYICSCEWFKM